MTAPPRTPYTQPRAPSSRFLPPDPNVHEPYRLTPGLALRVGIVGAVALAAFAVLFFRLWSLQVISGERYLSEAQNNQLRTIRVEAPRGYIVDRNGKVIVSNVPGTAVKLWVGDLPKQGRYDLIRRLAAVLDVRPMRLAREVDQRRSDPANPITVKTAVHEDQVQYLYEHQSEFPGVQIQQTYLRHYRYQSLAAQILGYVGEISAAELKRKARENYRLGDKIGKTGVEATYDAYLRGRPGLAEIQVDSLGRPQGSVEIQREQRPGNHVRLTVDIDLQRAAERALKEGIQLARGQGEWAAKGGAVVALDPSDGAVLAMASAPTYKPSVYVGRVDPKKIEPLINERAAAAANHPGLNRAIAGLYPPGSTWKPIVALAAMQEHLLAPYDSIWCTGSATYGLDKQVFRNWNPFVNRPMTLPTALAESCDTYFYEVGNRFYNEGKSGRERLQEWAHRFGFGEKAGLDIGGEATGLVPTPEWRKKTFKGSWDRAWNPGDSIQLAIGQKDLTVTPLQLARFYAMLANGGKLVTPYVVASVEQPGSNGQRNVTLTRFPSDPPQRAGVDPGALEPVREGLYAATHSANGTASGVFGSYPVPIAGKTGTAEKVVPLPGYPRDHLEDQSWWCGWGPYDGSDYHGHKPIVVCALIENGGHGSTAAAPTALRVFERWFRVPSNYTPTLVKTD
jgi:penicillin-binding protein 2